METVSVSNEADHIPQDFSGHHGWTPRLYAQPSSYARICSVFFTPQKKQASRIKTFRHWSPLQMVVIYMPLADHAISTEVG